MLCYFNTQIFRLLSFIFFFQLGVLFCVNIRYENISLDRKCFINIGKIYENGTGVLTVVVLYMWCCDKSFS